MNHKIRWTPEKIAQRLHLIEPLVYRQSYVLPPFRYLRLEGPMEKPPVSAEVDDLSWQLIQPGDFWGGPDSNFVMRTHFHIPAEWDAALPVALYLPLGDAGEFSHPEALSYVDGAAYSSCDRHHQEVRLPDTLRDGAKHTLTLHGWTGMLGGNPTNRLQMRPCAVVQVDQPTRDFVALVRVALGIANQLDENDTARGQLYSALNEAFLALDTRYLDDGFAGAASSSKNTGFYDSVPVALEILREGTLRAGAPLNVDITAAGHAHIDVAWLWTLGQTRRKAGRTFHNVARLMEQFPDFKFSQSQPQLYEYIRQDYPQLFETIRQRVQEGRWEAMGGMWVEADCNLSGSESLARQFLLGRSYFRKYFGEVDTPVLWLPDVFGYAWNLPQLIKEAGCEYFFTIKIGWSQYNRLPFDSFWWQGLDGTRVLTHFSTTPEDGSAYASTYNASATPEQTLMTWRNFLQKDLGRPGETAPLLMSFGYGDGGGGPTREMLENIREMGSFASTPHLHHGKVLDFYRDLETRLGDQLPVWNGELYLEYHRGTYTTQAKNKRANRKSEFLLHDAEFLATLAATLNPAYSYPREAFTQAWQLICLNQFHDILPGSSIGPVYVESQQQYAQIRQIGEQQRSQALAAIATQVGGDALLVNPTSFSRADLAFWPGEGGLARMDGKPLAVQAVEGGLLLDAGELPPFSVTPLRRADSLESAGPNTLSAAPDRLENDFLRVELNPAGDITRIFDKTNQRDVLPQGAIANQFLAFEDRPKNWDAWDVDIFYDDKSWLAEPASSIRVLEAGPLRATLEIKRRILTSEYVQRISLAHNATRLDFDVTMQWQERHILLKTAFPVDVLSPKATYEIQWGNVERPTHHNTSWDWARFETCAHKWVDLSEGGYGASLINDCKYGHDIRDNVMRLSLLRAPTMPDADADQGEQHFAYSFMPHAGSWDAGTISAAYQFNDPLLVHTVKQPAVTSAWLAPFLSLDVPNAVIETVKQAEDGRGIIVRLYETQRMRRKVTLTAAFPLAEAWRANLLEEDKTQLECQGSSLSFDLQPYQILTLRLIQAV